jgi:hypothetical protein
MSQIACNQMSFVRLRDSPQSPATIGSFSTTDFHPSMTQPPFLSSKPGYTVGVGVYSSSIILRHHHISHDIY